MAAKLFAGLLLLALLYAPAAHPGPAEDLKRLGVDYWEGHLKANPTTATALGDKRYDDRLTDISPEGRRSEIARLESVIERARAIPADALSVGDRLTRDALVVGVQSRLDRMACSFGDWVVNPMGGPQVSFMNLPDYTTIDTPEDAARFVARCRAIGPYMDQHIANLTRGLETGHVATRAAVDKVLEQTDRITAAPIEDWALMKPADADRGGWSADAKTKFRRDLSEAIQTTVRPALIRYRDFLEKSVLPASRPQEKAGLYYLPWGVPCYENMIRVHTSLDLTPDEIHKLGLAEVARFRRNLSELGGRVLGTTDVAEIQKRLRDDPAMHFETADEVRQKAEEALERARKAMPEYFGILPRTPCEVKVMGMHEAPYSTIAYYRGPSSDGSRPGYYMVNTYKPETRPRYEAEALAFHEAIPGHHLQIAISKELTGLPEFRKHQGVTAFVEGWALYTESLADEMGLYSNDLDRIGMLSYDAWRACRLVVDTGLHAMGWSRQRAIDYMLENSVLAENNIVNEVDRYLAIPGQALAYKIGQIEIMKLRDESRKRMGDRFDIREFHDVVLRNGAVALPVLRRQVEAWSSPAGDASGSGTSSGR